MAKSFEKEFEEQSIQTLYRKMRKTAKARFYCAQRLNRHHTFTLWSMSVFSAGLIVLSVLSAFQIQLQVDASVYSLLQFLLSLGVLVISLLLSSSNYSDRAEKMHRCALEINRICHEILPACRSNDDKALYETTLFKYSNILESYENHDMIDFAFVRLDLSEDYTIGKGEKLLIKARYWGSFWVHAFSITVLLTVFGIVLWKR